MPLNARDRLLTEQLSESLMAFAETTRSLPGIQNSHSREAFLRQLIDSIHRTHNIKTIATRDVSPRRADPSHPLFDPLKGAVFYFRNEQVDEAFWLVFLAIHFGQHVGRGWEFARKVYGKLNSPDRWSWKNVSSDADAFRNWLAEHQNEIQGDSPGGFGNHRKYQSLDAQSSGGTGAAFATYVMWVAPPRTHEQLIAETIEAAEGSPRVAFDHLYHSMSMVASFGRMARFDYLTTVGNLGFAKIEPGCTYMTGATGPLAGARLLFGGSKTVSLRPRDLEDSLVQLDVQLNVGMQVLEDALCNWQKSPTAYRRFYG